MSGIPLRYVLSAREAAGCETEISLTPQFSACQAKAEALSGTVVSIRMEIDLGLSSLQDLVQLRSAIEAVQSDQADALRCLNITRTARVPQGRQEFLHLLPGSGQSIHIKQSNSNRWR